MNIFQKIKSWFSKSAGAPASYVRDGIYPASDWQHILTLATVVVFLFAIFAFYLYAEINNGNIFGVPEDDTASQSVIDSGLLKKTISDMDARAAELNMLQQNTISVPDPSR